MPVVACPDYVLFELTPSYPKRSCPQTGRSRCPSPEQPERIAAIDHRRDRYCDALGVRAGCRAVGYSSNSWTNRVEVSL
jgi:hypothetical protein